MKYRVFVNFSDDSDIKVDVNAENEEEACKIAVSTQKVADYIEAGNLSIKNVRALQKYIRFEYRTKMYYKDSSKTKIRVTDNEKGTVVEFESGDYNGTAQCIVPPKFTDPNEVATAMREISEYVSKYHRQDCFSGESLSDYIAKSLSGAMNHAHITASELANRSGVVRGHIIGTLEGSHPIRAIELLQLCEAMGAELKIVFPEDE